MAEDVPAFDDLPSFDDLPDAPGGSAPAAQNSASSIPRFDDLPSFDEMPDGNTAAKSQRPAEGPLASGVREAAHAVIPAVVGTVAAGAGAVAGGLAGTAVAPGPGTAVGAGVGGVGGFVAGSMGAEYVQDKALKALGFDDDDQRAANAAANPKSTFVGGLAPAVATMNPVAAGEKLSQRLVQRGVGGAMMGGFEAGNEAMQGQDLDPVKLAISTAVGVAAPSFNRAGQKLSGVGERLVPGRPNRAANPDADTTHQAVNDQEPVDPHASSLAEPPPAMGEAQVATTGNPQSAPTRSSRVYSKGSDPAEQARYKAALDDPEAMREFAADQGLSEAEAREIAQANYEPSQGDMLTQGNVAPDVTAALKDVDVTRPIPGFDDHPSGVGQPAPRPRPVQSDEGLLEASRAQRQGLQNAQTSQSAQNTGQLPPRAAAAVNQSKGRLGLKTRPLTEQPGEGPTGDLGNPKRAAPEPVVETGFPKEGEPLAVGENEAAKMPAFKGEAPINASITEGQKAAGNYPKARTHDFGKPQKVETHAGDTRSGKGPDGTPWENKSPYDYGYFNKTVGKDKDHIDFARPPAGSPEHGDKHFIIDQKGPDGKFDEHKVFTYYKDEAAARKHYEEGFSDGKGADRLGAITEVSRGDLVKFLQRHTSKAANKPYAMAEEAAQPAAKPLAERAVVKDLIAKGKTTPEAIAALPPEQVEAAIEGKRTRKYGVGTGASAGYPVEGILTSEGKPVTANTKAKAAERSAMHKQVVDWFNASAPKKADETNGELLDRLKGAPEPSYKPAHKPAEWMLAREAKQVLSKPTPARIEKFKEAERLLRGAPEDVDNYRGGNRVEADIARSKRGGDEAVAKAEASNVDLGRNTAEDDMIAAIDAKRHPTYATIDEAQQMEFGVTGTTKKIGGETFELLESDGKFAWAQHINDAKGEMVDWDYVSHNDAIKLGLEKKPRFDVPHEEAETMVEPKPVKTAADLKELPRKTIDVKDSSLAKIDTNAISKKVLSDADARLVGRKSAARAAESEGAASPVKQIKVVDETEKARLLAALNKAAAKKGAEVDALPAERDPDVVPKRFTDLFDKFASDEAGAVNVGKIKADVKRLMGTLTKTTDHKSYIAAESKNAMDDYARSLGEDFQRIRGEDTNHQLRMQQEASALPKEINNPKALEEIYHAREADSAGIKPKNGAASNIDNLDPALKALYDKHLKPIFDQNDTLAAAIRQAFPERMGADVQHHIQRLRKGATPEYNMLLSHDDPTSPLYNGLMVNANAAKDRKFYALERNADGRRTIIVPTDAGFDTHIKGKIQKIKDANFDFEDGKGYKAGPVDYTMRQATTREIERHVLDDNKKPMEFYHNAGFSAATTNLQLGSMLRHLEALERIKQTPEFKANSAREGTKKAEQEGYQEPNLPNFKGTAVHPAIKAALDDYAGIPQNAVRRLSAAVTKTLFWMPTAHINNVGAHWLSARGFDNFTPQGMKRLMQTAREAFKSVINQDAYQMKMRENGAGLIYGGVLTRDPVQKMARVFQMDMKANPSKYGPIADKLGVPLKSLAGAIYDNASKVMWSVNDVLLTQRVMELEKTGKTMPQAIVEAERDIPNYRLPIKIMGSRWLQQQLSDPLKVAFGRYHYGMFNSYANQFKDLLGNKATPGDRLEAAGRLMVTGMLLSVIYPMIWDKGAQLLTGNPDAKAQRRGPAAIPDKIIDALHGKTDLMAAARSSLTLPPLTTTALETLQNRDFRGKPIVEPGDLAGSATQKGRAAVQLAAHTAKGLISPLSTISTNAQKDVSPMGAVRDQATDVKNPSAKAVKYEKLIDMHNQRDTVQRFKKGGSDPIEGLYNKLFGYK